MIEKEMTLKKRAIIGSIVLILILTTVFLINSNLSGFVTYDKSVQTISWAKAGSELLFETKVKGVSNLNIKVKEDIKGGLIKIEEVGSVECDFKGIKYSQFKINSPDENKISSTEFTLKVEKKYLDSLKVSHYDVKLYRDCVELPTSYKYIRDGHVYLTSQSKGFGEFVVGKTSVKEAVKSVSPETVPKTTEISEEEQEISEEVLEEVEEISQPEIIERSAQAIAQKPVPLERNGEKSFFNRFIDFFKNLFS